MDFFFFFCLPLATASTFAEEKENKQTQKKKNPQKPDHYSQGLLLKQPATLEDIFLSDRAPLTLCVIWARKYIYVYICLCVYGMWHKRWMKSGWHISWHLHKGKTSTAVLTKSQKDRGMFSFPFSLFSPAAVRRDPNLDTIMRQRSLFRGLGAHCGADECEGTPTSCYEHLWPRAVRAARWIPGYTKIKIKKNRYLAAGWAGPRLERSDLP